MLVSSQDLTKKTAVLLQKDTLVIVSRGLLNDVTEGRTPARNRYVERFVSLDLFVS